MELQSPTRTNETSGFHHDNLGNIETLFFYSLVCTKIEDMPINGKFHIIENEVSIHGTS